MTTRSGLNFRNILILLGILITSIGLIYFATEFIDRISDWGKLTSLVLLTVVFVALGAHFETGPEADALVERSGWRWLRVASALYVLGLVTAFVGIVFFLSMDEVARVVKVLVTILFGLGLILVAARRYGVRPPDARAP